MEDLSELETQLVQTVTATNPLHVTREQTDFWLANPQLGNDFLMGRVGAGTLVLSTRLETKIWGRPPDSSEIGFSEYLELLHFPLRVKFDFQAENQLCVGYQDGFLKLQSRQGLYYRHIDSIDLMFVSPVDNSNLRF